MTDAPTPDVAADGDLVATAVESAAPAPYADVTAQEILAELQASQPLLVSEAFFRLKAIKLQAELERRDGAIVAEGATS